MSNNEEYRRAKMTYEMRKRDTARAIKGLPSNLTIHDHDLYHPAESKVHSAQAAEVRAFERMERAKPKPEGMLGWLFGK